MVKAIKNTLRKLLFALGIDLTKNQQYDRQTLAIMKKWLKPDSNCLDIGCHKGEVLDEMIKMAPQGNHFGFEPIPEYYDFLIKKYQGNNQIKIVKKALSDSNGVAEFNWVKNAPAYSGLKERSYAIKNPGIEKIEVALTKLDECDIQFPTISLIKIDVEGAEMKVLNGAVNFIKKHQPLIVFECGLGAANFYGVKPADVFDQFEKIGYHLHTLKGWLANDPGLASLQFTELFDKNIEYYFVASPKVK